MNSLSPWGKTLSSFLTATRVPSARLPLYTLPNPPKKQGERITFYTIHRDEKEIISLAFYKPIPEAEFTKKKGYIPSDKSISISKMEKLSFKEE